ncbi:hypothetical protein B7463_g11295, partial [Scytalidium lignicola]
MQPSSGEAPPEAAGRQHHRDPKKPDQMVPGDTSTESGSISGSAIDHQGQGSHQKKHWYTVPASQFAADVGTSPGTSIGSIDSYAFLNEAINREASNQELIWNQFSSELESYSNLGIEIPTYPGRSDFMELTGTTSSSDTITSRTTDTSFSLPDVSSSIAKTGFDSLAKTSEIVPTSMREGRTLEFEAVIAAEGAWPLARCNPPIFTGTCPRTAVIHLESLEQYSKHESTWKALEQTIASTAVDCENRISVLSLSSGTRDRILAITQRFLYIALKTHEGQTKEPLKDADLGKFNFLVLPPSNVLEYFLRSHVRSLAPYYALVGRGTLDPNEMVLNAPASTLLLLLMIAHGATAFSTAEAKCLAAGLTETCRISLFHIIEKDVELSANAVVLECALLFTILGAWSGDAWHMNIAMGQRGMYLAMLKHAGFLESFIPVNVSISDYSRTQVAWSVWREREHKSRLVYNWVSIDLELSLFHDTAPILLITELKTPIPGSDSLWFAKDYMEWLAILPQTDSGANWLDPNSGYLAPRSSMRDLFQQFVHDKTSTQQCDLSPLQLRLLLHPLQSLVCQISGCFSNLFGSRRAMSTVTKMSTLVCLEELQSLLQKWYCMSAAHAKADAVNPITRVNLVLYHLISLNAVTSFPEIERLARKEDFSGSTREISLRCERCIYQQEETFFHCGQIIRLICSMPTANRPHWWSAALYRAALILWVNSLSIMDRKTQGTGGGRIFAIDAFAPDDPSLISCLWNVEGIPVLGMGDHRIKLDDPDGVLTYFILLLDQGPESQILDGIKRKLQTLSKSWSGKMQDHI